jgi:sulfate adenylyltransferase
MHGGDGPVTPYGGTLVQLVADPERAQELLKQSLEWPSWELTPRQLCDLELLLCGGFSPLQGFMNRAEHESVCASMRLPQGLLWPIPVTLDVPDVVRAAVEEEGAGRLALRDPEGALLAVLYAQDVFRPDPQLEAERILGTTDPHHPGVRHLEERTHPWLVGGAVEGVRSPVHHDFRHLRSTPAALRRAFAVRGWRRVVAFQTRNPMHRAHQELTLRAATEVNAGLLVHPVVGSTRPGDVDHYTRVRCYQAIMPSYPAGTAVLSLLPLAMRMAGPREALWHAIIRRNYGASHLIVGRDHAGPGVDSQGRPFYPPYAAQDLLRRHERELGITMVPFREMVYLEDVDRYVPEDEVPPGARTRSISGTEQRRHLAQGQSLPEWFTPQAVAAELRRTYPPRSRQGFTVFLTGLPAAGKSTIANVLLVKLLEGGGRRVTLLDGDLVRKHLSAGLGFSRADRDANIRRIGFVAAEVSANGGVAICAAIAPYHETRREIRAMVEREAGFVLVHVATPIKVCELRDRKGLYAKAHAGLLSGFTGVSDAYEPPDDAEVVVDASVLSAEQAADRILAHLQAEGYLPQPSGRLNDSYR